MTPTEYQQLAERTENKDFQNISKNLNKEQTLRLLHAAIGLATEAGEFLDAMKKHIFYGKPLDLANIREELGDHMWYIAEACNAIDESLEDVMAVNIQKLKCRYPNKFTKSDALNRDLDAEKEILDRR